MPTSSERLAILIEANTKSYENAMKRIEQKTNQAIRASEKSVKRLNTTLRQSASAADVFSRAIGAAGIVTAATAVARAADVWTTAANKLAAASQIAGRTARSLSDINKIATGSRSGLEETVDLYSKMLVATKDVAKSEAEVARATDIVNKSFKAGGQAASAQAAGIMQLGQALGSGTLSGDELKSIRENAPVLAQAIAEEFKTTIAGLKDLGAAGELTSERVFRAILKAGPAIEVAFNTTKSTVGDAMTQLRNSFIEAAGGVDKLTGSTEDFVQNSARIANAVKSVTDRLVDMVDALKEGGNADLWERFRRLAFDLDLGLGSPPVGQGSQESLANKNKEVAAAKEALDLAEETLTITRIAAAEGKLVNLTGAEVEVETLRQEYEKLREELKEVHAAMLAVAAVQYDPLSSVRSGPIASGSPAAPLVSTGVAPITNARQFVGLDENRDADILSNLFKQAGQNIDPKMVAWCAAFVNAALATSGLPGTGSNMARSFLDYGERTETPQVGDIVVLKRGNSETQGHVGFYEGQDAQGNVRVLGGNQSDGVNVKSFNPSEVLGYRKIPGAGDASASGNPIEDEIARRSDATKKALEDQKRAQEDAAEALERQREDLAAILTDREQSLAFAQLDVDYAGQSAAALEEQRIYLEEINKLKALGVDLTSQEGIAQVEAARKYAAGLAGIHATQEAQIEAAKVAEEAAKDAEQSAIDRADSIRDLGADVLGGLASDLANGVKPAEALANALQKIAEKLLDIGINALTSSLFGEQGTQLGGIFGSLFGGGAPAAALPMTGLATGLAKGGVMTSSGPVPLRRYAGGGVARSPQMALYGEGSKPEAYVPLPDGRNIPVRLDMPRLGDMSGRRGVQQQKVAVENIVRLEPSPEFIGTVESRARQTEARTLARTPGYLQDQQKRTSRRG